MTRFLITSIIAVSFVSLSACNNSGDSAAATTDRCEHDIKMAMCPFCTPALIDSDGFCGEHGVPEALCYQCRPYLKTAFRKKGDWCAEHDAPDSQCMICHPELKDKIDPDAGHGAAMPDDHDHDDLDHDH